MSRDSRQIVIDRIVFDGFGLTSEQQDAFRLGLTAELERRLAEDWVESLADRRAGQVQAPPLELAAGAQPADIAAQVASGIVEGLKA